MINRYQTILIEKKLLTSDVFLFRFKLVSPTKIDFQPGQYLILKVNNQSRLYSIFSPNNLKNQVELLVKIIPGGLTSSYLKKLELGTRVDFQGPAGLLNLKQNSKNKVFLATSTGLAPLWSMIVSYLKRTGATDSPKIYLFFGLRNFADVFLLDELKQLSSSYPQFKFFISFSRELNLKQVSVEDQKYFRVGRINSAFEEIISQQCVNDFDYYLCGSREVVESLNQHLLSKGVIKENILFEKF